MATTGIDHCHTPVDGVHKAVDGVHWNLGVLYGIEVWDEGSPGHNVVLLQKVPACSGDINTGILLEDVVLVMGNIEHNMRCEDLDNVTKSCNDCSCYDLEGVD